MIMNKHQVKDSQDHIISNPPIARFLFEDTRFASVWLIVRVLLGWVWLNAGLGKLGNPAWMQTGDALKGFLTNAVAVSDTGKTPIAFDWYRNFIQGLLDSGSYVWFAKLVAISETLIGIALILGLFVGIAAFVGSFMNWSFIMAGTASSNGLLFVAAILLILAWKTAGYYGLDRFLLPRLGTPWRSGRQDDPHLTPLQSATHRS
jgi:thiosulfate dehydrogenase [quinone] large subunit